MNALLLATSIVPLLALPLRPHSDLPPEVLLLSKIRQRAKDDFSHIPNFTCLEVIHRASGRPPNALRAVDTIQVEVAHFGDRDLFAWPGSGTFEDRPLQQMVGVGLIGRDEYFAHARNLFIGGAALIRYSGAEELRGRPAARYDFKIASAFSGISITVEGSTAVVGEQGSFWADSNTYDLLRIATDAVEIPDELGVRRFLTEIDYGRMRLSSGEFLLPQSARMSLLRESGEEQENRIGFRNCRAYAAESSVATEAAALREPETKPEEIILPVGYVISLRLDTPVRTATAKVGDPISAVLDRDFRLAKQVIVPKGAIVSGRLRLLEHREDVYLAGLDFTDVTFASHHASFQAMLLSSDDRYLRQKMITTTGSVTHDDGSRSTQETIEVAPEIPGVGTFFIPHSVTELPRGLRMRWRIVGLGK